MPDGGSAGTSPPGHGGRGSGWGPPRRRPPWWPENEPWPPADWHGRRRAWRGFGCLFGLLFLLVVGSFVAVAAFVLSQFGWFAAVVVAVVLIAIVVSFGRFIGRSGRVLDELLEATRRVEAGDYSVRVPVPERGPRPLRQLVSGFDTMVERLEADERQRRSLLADVSHELRTPLAVLQGNLEAIVDGVHPADEAHLGALVEETRVLARLIEDLRTVALSEAGTLALHREPVDVGVVAADVATSFRADASAAGIELVVDVPEELRLLDADPVRLREVLANLLANALRHTPAGGSIRLAARVPSGDQGLEIIVSDTGRGIPPDLLPHVFDRFAKSAESHGSGLGLAIAKALVEAHGGTISAMSPPGDGATGTAMTIRLPLDDRSVRGAA
jgi:signal transduction histidine kinase